MEEAEFWDLIERSRSDFDPKRMNGNMDRQLKSLKKLLKKFGPDEIGEFDGLFGKIRSRAYDYDLWACAYLRDGGCSDDCFIDFRSWMVSMGRQPFLRMIEDADNLADYCDQPGVEDIAFEGIAYIANELYTELHDPEGIPDYYYEQGDYTPPAGRDWKPEEIDYFKTRFPRMWDKRCRISWPD